MARKYENVYHELSLKRVARCGHPTAEGRFFRCEKCQPVLPSDEKGGWEYFSELDEEELEEETV